MTPRRLSPRRILKKDVTRCILVHTLVKCDPLVSPLQVADRNVIETGPLAARRQLTTSHSSYVEHAQEMVVQTNGRLLTNVKLVATTIKYFIREMIFCCIFVIL